MTDFNGLNPEQHLKTSFNANKQGKGAQQDQTAEQGETAPAVDPYADQKLSPDHLMSLLAAQAKLNIPSEVENAGINQAVAKFTTAISPERHARLSRIISQAYEQEFGQAPPPELLQDIVDDYLIGRPNVQAS